MSVWVWFIIAAGLLLVFRTIALSAPQRAESARRIQTTVVLTALGLAVVHAWHQRGSRDLIQRTTAAADLATEQAIDHIARAERRSLRDAQIDERTPIIRKRLLVAAWAGEEGMYEGRAAFIEHCGGCHAQDGGGVPDQARSPAIIGLGDRGRDQLVPYLSAEHPLPYRDVLSDVELLKITTFLWTGLRDPLP